jgi:aminopeptidase-like protein
MGGQLDQPLNELAMLWVLNLSDGAYSLLDIATRSGLPFETIQQATDVLVTHGLLKECDEL